MLFVPSHGISRLEQSYNTTSAAGQTLTASGSIHTLGSYSSLIDPTTYPSYGITVMIGGTGLTATTNERALCNVAIEPTGGGTQQVIIPSLMCGNTNQWGAASGCPVMYHFPIFIPAGVRVSAALQALIASDTAEIVIWLHHSPAWPHGWVGSRVTAYGANTGTSSGVSHSPGNSSYAAATEIVASCANPIRYMQIGTDLGTDTTGSTARQLIRIGLGATPVYITEGLPAWESTTLECNNASMANMILSQMRFNIPAATRLTVSSMRNATAEARGFIIYGVD